MSIESAKARVPSLVALSLACALAGFACNDSTSGGADDLGLDPDASMEDLTVSDAGPEAGITAPGCVPAMPPPDTRAASSVPCGGSVSEPPCLIGQLLATPDLSAFGRLWELARTCETGAERTALFALDIIASEGSLLAPVNAATEEWLGERNIDLDVAEMQLEAGGCDAVEADFGFVAQLFLHHVAIGRLSAEELRAAPGGDVPTALNFDADRRAVSSVTLNFDASACDGMGAFSVLTRDGERRFGRLVATDIAVTVDNGDDGKIIHAIDRVLEPPSVLTLLDDLGLGDFANAARAATTETTVPLADQLTGITSNVTVFAVRDEDLDVGANPSGAALDALLRRHIVSEFSPRLDRGLRGFELPSQLDTLAGTTLRITRDGETVLINGGSAALGATVIQTDLVAANGTIHVIDRPLPE